VKGAGGGLEGLFESITIVLSTPFLIAGLVALILNLGLPKEEEAPLHNAADEDAVLEEEECVEQQRVHVEDAKRDN